MPIAILLANLLPTILSNIPGLPATLLKIIQDVGASVAAILASGVTSAPSVNTVLAAWLGVITSLRNDPSLPAGTLAAIAQLEKAVQAALTEDAVAAKQVDWTLLKPIQTV